MPDHKDYLEPFFGNGAVLFNKEPSHYNSYLKGWCSVTKGALVEKGQVQREKLWMNFSGVNSDVGSN